MKQSIINLALWLAAVLAAGAQTSPVKKVPAKRVLPTNVILITLDTVRADHMGYNGYKDIQTTTLDALAHDGIVFDRAISQVPLTWPSHAVILTGTYPFQNGVQDFTGQPLDPRFRSVAQAFKRNGYSTGAVVSAFVLDKSWGLARGFDFYDDAFSPEQFKNRDLGLVDRKATESVDHALKWLTRNPKRPFFFWLHLYDPHSAYDPPEPYHTQYAGHLYDGEIAYADHEIGRLIGWLKTNKLYDSSAIVFLSDHGESLGDHGEKEHGYFIYNSTVHIPLIVKPPVKAGLKPGRTARPVETVAVAPTLLSLAGLQDEISKQFHSPGLLGEQAEKADAAYSETFYTFSSYGWSPLHGLQTSRYHYIDAPEAELYDVSADPGETNNLLAQQPAAAAVLKDRMQQLMKTNPFRPSSNAVGNVNPDALEKLGALGYVAYRSPVSPDALAAGLPDPKSKLWEFNTVLEATDAFHAGKNATGRALLAKVEERDPKMYIIPFLRGEAALTEQNWDAAAQDLRKCLELNPNFDQAMTALARALMFSNKLDEAKQWANKALQLNSQNYRAWYELGYIDAKKGDRKAAVADYEKAIAIQPNFAPIRRDLGMLHFQDQNFAEAIRHLDKAVELGLREPMLFNFLGIAYSRTGQLAKAVQAYQQALTGDPNRAEVHLNLGFAYQRMGKAAEAKKEYAEACRLDEKMCELRPQTP
ncbi:MAG TPA: sulfatase-like hydrolase/transferase [Terriglobales bacterium]|jgi:arylsulfatase A-like enzyme/Flp pilus assembly protein TadD